MFYLSRNDIEQIAERTIAQYKTSFVPEHHLCYNVDPSELAMLLGFRIAYVNITKDGSILGQTSCGCAWTPIVGPNGEDYLFYLDGKTILVEERLLRDSKSIGRKNFTIAHELAHQIINREYHNMCEMLGGISIKTGYELLRSGKIKSFQIGRNYRIPKIFILEYIGL